MAAIVFQLANELSSSQGAMVLQQQLANVWANMRSNSASRSSSSLPSYVPAASKKVVLTSGGSTFTIPFADPKVSHTNMAKTRWQVVQRAGAKDVVANSGENLRQLRMTGIIGDVGGSAVDAQIAALREMTGLPGAITVAYGALEAATQWRCSDLQVDPQIRVPGTNDTWWASFSMTFIEDSPAPYPTPVPNTPPPAPLPAANAPSAPSAAGPRTYIVKQGDTLSAIAVRMYGNAAGWPRIASENGIRDPRRLQIGTTLRIP